MLTRPRARKPRRTRALFPARALLAGLVLILVAPVPAAADAAPRLEQRLGRSEVLVLGDAMRVTAAGDLEELELIERLERTGYRRVHERPGEAGTYFWGKRRLWIFRRAFRRAGRDLPAQLWRIPLSAAGRLGPPELVEGPARRGARELRLEGEILAESLDQPRARRVPIDLDAVPERVWRAVLAAEDARFFEHGGVDGRALARAMLANLRAGKVVQGGSTITQQLVKNRDLTPRRSLGRKASEAFLSLVLESQYDKREILQAYLNSVYMGHVDGLAIHGLGTAARVFFSRTAAELSLGQAAALAALIQGPNRLSPLRHAEELTERRDWVIGRLSELGWVEADAADRARREPLRVRPSAPERPGARHFLAALRREVAGAAGRRGRSGRGLRIESTLDPLLQREAEGAIADGLARLRRRVGRRAREDLSAALVALDRRSGAVRALVGGDPRRPGDDFDRASLARRQPGSAIKPLLLLEALESCGEHDPLTAATRIDDGPLTIDLPSGPWRPENFDHGNHGTVTLRDALRRSLNLPFVRIARHCGFDATARRMRRAGLTLPQPVPPSVSLGAVETTPLELASAYLTVFGEGERLAPRAIEHVESPSGRRLHRTKVRPRRVVHASTAWLIDDLLRDAVRRGTGKAAAVEGLELAGKTGSSSGLRDAWFAGRAGALVVVVWVGRDSNGPLGLTGAQAAAPIWRRFAQAAAGLRPAPPPPRPSSIVERTIDRQTGLRLSRLQHAGGREWFRRSAQPPRDRLFRRDRPVPVLR